MVEVGSTKQSLKTPVSDSQSTHAEAGSEIHRDEVPPMYQEFCGRILRPDQKTFTNPASNLRTHCKIARYIFCFAVKNIAK